MGVKLRYYDNDPSKGIIYDWDYIRREYRKLKCPKDVYNPLKPDFDKCGINIAISDRSQGKTTNPLLAGQLMLRDYGTQCHYIRQSSDMTTPKILRDLYKTIREYHYIEKIWDGQYNDVEYRGKRWSLILRDDDGQIVARHPEPCLVCFGLDESDAIKSSYNAPRGDMLIYDEFIASDYGYSDAVRFFDICKTIFRDRYSPVIWMLSNNINLNSPWFDELCIRDEVNRMQQGDYKSIQVDDGPLIYVDILPPKISEQREKVNRRFFGFPNPKLAAITGKGAWSTESYQHIPPDDEDDPVETVIGNLYISQSGRLVRCRIIDRKSIGLCVYVTPATKTYQDSIIMTAGDITDRRQIWGYGPADSPLMQLLWRLYKANRWYYLTNSEGALVRSYLALVRSMQRDRMMI